MSLNLNKISELYFSRLFLDTKLQGSRARALLVDDSTTATISMSYTQSLLLQNDVILVEQIKNAGQLSSMSHLDCIVYISPSTESLDHLVRELASPHFTRYLVFFNNSLKKKDLEQLAEADALESVDSVVELFQDYLPVNDNLFLLNLPGVDPRNLILQESNGLVSLLLSIRKCPIIKFEKGSLEIRRLASEVLFSINSNSNNNLFDDVNKLCDRPPILLFLDRKSDPATPLLAPWTYQSMVHEFIGITKKIAKPSDSTEAIVLSETQDPFWRESMYMNYGDLTEKFQKYVDDYKKKTQQLSLDNLKTQNLAELKQILTKFPEYKKLSTNILKHLNLISDLDKHISAQNLWELGELQQNIVCALELQPTLKTSVLETLDNTSISTANKYVLTLLYAIKYPDAPEISLFAAKLNDSSLTAPVLTPTQNKLLSSAGKLFTSNSVSTARSNNKLGDLFHSKNINLNSLFSGNGSPATRSKPRSDNVYMQYVPRLGEILDELINGPHSNEENPNKPLLISLIPDVVSKQYGDLCAQDPIQDIIVYFKGGVTYEEVRLAHEMASGNPQINLIIGSDEVLNSDMWLNKLYDVINEGTESPLVDAADTSISRRAQLREIL